MICSIVEQYNGIHIRANGPQTFADVINAVLYAVSLDCLML
jgi:hypothetical protein